MTAGPMGAPMLDASGIVHFRDDLYLVAEDETDRIRLFELSLPARRFAATGRVLDFGSQESDFESLAFDPRAASYYAIGSHSADYSQRLLAFELDGDMIRHATDLRFAADHLVDGEINIEALTVVEGRLLAGYRSPARGGRALAVLFDPASGDQLLLDFDLQGRVCRDLARIDETNYLVLAGPEHGSDYDRRPPRLFWWNGQLFPRALRECAVDLRGIRAEGLGCHLHADGHLDLLVGSDESKVEGADRFRLFHLGLARIEQLWDRERVPDEFEVRLA